MSPPRARRGGPRGGSRPAARPRLALLLAACLLAPALARADEEEEEPGRLELWAEVGAGADGNPARTPGVAQAPRGFAALLGRARLRLEGEAASAQVTLTEAARLYGGEADALASRLEASGRAALGAGLSAALTASGSDTRQRDGLLDRHALRGEGVLAWRAGALQASAAGGWSLFTPREPLLRPFRSSGPEGWVRLAWWPAPAHQVSLGAGRAWADFPGWAAAGAPGSPTRRDEALLLSAGWTFRGAALLSLGWDYTDNRSGAPGGDFTRHRLTASGALGLPADLTLAARLALQWSQYPDPLLLPAEQRLAEGREALDQAEARLSRPLAGPVEAALTLAWYHARGGAGVPGYQRGVATLALCWRGRP